MTNDAFAFERECDAARDRWEKLPGDEIAEVIDHLGDGKDAVTMMIYLAKRNYHSDAYEVLTSLLLLAPFAKSGPFNEREIESAQEFRDFISANNPILLMVFDKYAKLAAEEMKIHEAWIEGEADAVLNFPDNGQDRAFEEAGDK